MPLRIEKLVYGGDGLARAEGRVVLVPFVLPGELVSVEVHPVKKDLLRGNLSEILEPSLHRIQAPCPYFQHCGGCHYQHTSYSYQTEQKLQILIEVLRRVGQIEWANAGLVTGEAWRYRNRTQLHISHGEAGYFAAGSHALVAVDHCPISSPRLNDAIAALVRELPHYRWFDATVELFTNETDLQVNVLDRIPSSVRELFDRLGTRNPIQYGAFRVSRNSFFQVNRFLVDRLVDTAIGGLSGASALDLYAGVGLFAHALTRQFKAVTAVESSGSAFRDLEVNLAGLSAVPVRRTAEDYLTATDAAPDLIVADPPRTGLGKIVIRELLRLRAARIVVVSCDPATLARDLQILTGGGYQIGRVTLVDLFPQTFHLEVVVELCI